MTKIYNNLDNSELSFNDAPLEFQVRIHQKNEKKYLSEIEKLKTEVQRLNIELKKTLEHHRIEKELIADKFGTPLTSKQSNKYSKAFLQQKKLWGQYSMWLLKEKGYLKEN